jgi:hypothetical protein
VGVVGGGHATSLPRSARRKPSVRELDVSERGTRVGRGVRAQSSAFAGLTVVWVQGTRLTLVPGSVGEAASLTRPPAASRTCQPRASSSSSRS